MGIPKVLASLFRRNDKPVPEEIIELAYAWLGTAVLLAAVDLEIFSTLAETGPLTHLQIREKLNLNPRSTPDFPDTLLAMNLLEREGDGPDALYSNTKEGAVFLDKKRPLSYLGDRLKEILRLYRDWIDHPKFIRKKENKDIKLQEVTKTFRTVADFHLFKSAHQGAVTEEERNVSPDAIIQIALSFWTSRVLLTACELQVFTIIGAAPKKRLSKKQIAHELHLCGKTTAEFLDTLVSGGMLKSKMVDGTKMYSNNAASAYYLDRNKEFYIGGLMEFFSAYHYAAAASLSETLRTGTSQLAAKGTELDFYTALYPHEGAAEGLAFGLMSVMIEASVVFSKTFSLKQYKTAIDVGGASGHFAARMAQQNPGLQVTVTDRAEMVPVTQKFINERWPDVKDRVIPMEHDYFKEASFPSTDVITMTMVLLQWGLEKKKELVRKAYEALSPGGVLVVIDHYIMDDERRYDAFGLRKSLLMYLIHGNHVDGKTGDEVGGRTFTFGEYKSWCLEAGFSKVKMVNLPGQPMPAGVAWK